MIAETIVALAMILLGANALTDGASSVAKRFGVPDLVIGLTIVALGTSAPEFIVSLTSALHGSTGMSVGNVVGSNIFNTLIIVGVSAMIVPIHINKGTLSKDIPLNLIACIVLAAVIYDGKIDGADGTVLVCMFAIFMRHTFSLAQNSQTADEAEITQEMNMAKSALWIVGGLTLLVVGGNLFVDGGSKIARLIGIPESIIALTLMSGGTSLPELATSVVAARKGNVDMAIGNVIGSNIFNIFFVLGICGMVTPLQPEGIGMLETTTLIASGLLLWTTGMFYKTRTITRLEGILLVAIYCAYTGMLIYRL